jgi:Leucine-rich repeat (LRR) protein
MNYIENEIEELKSMQQYPRFYLANFWSDLKRQVDLVFQEKENEKEKYSEIIKRIEIDENASYKRNNKPFQTFDDEIKSIDSTQVDGPLAAFQLIDDIKYKIEQKLFQNKSILFIENYGKLENTFLLIINDEYLRQITFIDDNFSNKSEYFNREKLIAYFLEKKLTKLSIDTNIVSLNIDIINETSIEEKKNKLYKIDKNIFKIARIKHIHQSSFQSFISLEKISFIDNQIQELHSELFMGLTNLKEINMQSNKIKLIHPNTFNGLTRLEKINLANNAITELDSNTFNGLNMLKNLSLGCNRLKEINENTFAGLTNLDCIKLCSNFLKEIHPATFIGLPNLKIIDLSCNYEIKEIHENTFAGLLNLEFIDFSYNKFKNFNPKIFKNLCNLKLIIFRSLGIRNDLVEINDLDIHYLNVLYISNDLFIFKDKDCLKKAYII